MLISLINLAVMAVVATAVTVHDCPAGVKRDKNLKMFENSCFRFEIGNPQNSQGAEDYCKKYGGGRLAMVKSESANNFLKQSIDDLDYSQHYGEFWLGLRFYFSDHHYEWADGSRMKDEDYNSFRDHTGEDAVIQDTDQCVVLSPVDEFWFDAGCSLPFNFICEYPIDVSTSNAKQTTQKITTTPTASTTTSSQSDTRSTITHLRTTSVTTQHVSTSLQTAITHTAPSILTLTEKDCNQILKRYKDDKIILYKNKCYRFHHTTSVPFDDAQKDCNRDGGSLAIVRSKEINDFIFQKIQMHTAQRWPLYWIGIRRPVGNATFSWVDGSGVSYENFQDRNILTTHYGSGKTDETVTLDSIDGKWYVASWRQDEGLGHNNHPYVCEYTAQNLIKVLTPVTTMQTSTITTAHKTSPTVLTSGETAVTFTQPQTENTSTITPIPKTDNFLSTITNQQTLTTKQPTTTQKLSSTQRPTTTSQNPITAQQSTATPQPTTITQQPITTFQQKTTTQQRTTTQQPKNITYKLTTSTEQPTRSRSTQRLTSTSQQPKITKRVTPKCPEIFCDKECIDYVQDMQTGCLICACKTSTTTTSSTTITNPTVTTTTTATTQPPPQPTTTQSTTTIRSTCPTMVCALDCGLEGLAQDPITGCLICQCDY